MEAVCSSKTLVSTYQSARRYCPEDQHRHLHRRENFKYHVIISIGLLITTEKRVQHTKLDITLTIWHWCLHESIEKSIGTYTLLATDIRALWSAQYGHVVPLFLSAGWFPRSHKGNRKVWPCLQLPAYKYRLKATCAGLFSHHCSGVPNRLKCYLFRFVKLIL
jgi:hypothetical protein